MTPPIRRRAGVIWVEDDAVALIERVRSGATYHLFPGGKIEPNEKPHDAAVREAVEELGVQLEIVRAFAEVTAADKYQLYFIARYVAGTFGTGESPELRNSATDLDGTHRPVWMPLSELERIDCRPVGLARLVSARAHERRDEQVHRLSEP